MNSHRMIKLSAGFAILMILSGTLYAGGAQEAAVQESGDGPFVESAGVKLMWEASGEELLFTLHGETTGWVSVGIDPGRVMKDAQIVIAYVEDGKLIGEDHFGTGIFTHKADTELGGSSDVRFISGEEVDGVSTIRFALPMDSGDQFDVPLQRGAEHVILLARGPDGADNFSSKHAAKGKIKVMF